MNDIFETRRKNLLSHIADKHQGNRAEYCRAIGKNPNLINLTLTRNPDHRKNIGEKLARDLEHLSNLPDGWLDATERKPPPDVVNVPVVSNDMAINEMVWLSMPKDVAKKLRKGPPRVMMVVIQNTEAGLEAVATKIKANVEI